MVNKYYQENKEKLQKEARERYKILPEEEKEKDKERLETDIKNLSEEEKRKKASVSS